jgi:hypothetical protein
MGIVAYCPHGHRLKVKDELAGRKGICPECGTRFRIPLESQPEPTVSAALPAAAVSPPALSQTGRPVATVVSFDAELAATLPRALPLAPSDAGGPPD